MERGFWDKLRGAQNYAKGVNKFGNTMGNMTGAEGQTNTTGSPTPLIPPTRPNLGPSVKGGGFSGQRGGNPGRAGF